MSRILETRENLVTQKYKKSVHDGIDIIGKPKSCDYIISHSDGVVVSVRSDYKTVDKTGTSYGNYVKIKHDNGYYTLYAHLKYGSVRPVVNQKVTKGQVIGYMGATGHTNGSHLHFEVRDVSDKKIDPTPYIDSDLPNIAIPTNQKLYLPATVKTWRVYPMNKKPIVGNECGKLLPSKFGGLEYEILDWTIENTVAVIQTRDYGKVQIYVAKDTDAIIKNG